MNKWDQINHVALNTSQKSYRKRFEESLSDQLEHLNVEEMINKAHDHLINQQIERIDKTITMILQKAIQGIQRNIPHSKQKVNIRVAKLHWRDKFKEIRGMHINEEKMEARRRIAMTNENSDISCNEMKEKLRMLIRNGSNYLKKARNKRERNAWLSLLGN